MDDNSDSNSRRAFIHAYSFCSCFDGDTSDKNFIHITKQYLDIRMRKLEKDHNDKHKLKDIDCDEDCIKANKKLSFINKVKIAIEQVYEQEGSSDS